MINRKLYDSYIKTLTSDSNKYYANNGFKLYWLVSKNDSNCYEQLEDEETGNTGEDQYAEIRKNIEATLNYFSPHFTIEQYEDVVTNMVKQDTYDNSGYYGDFDNYGYVYINPDEFFNKLNEINRINNAR